MKKFYVFILATVSLFLGSCSLLQSPELYDEGIRDVVKFQLAEVEYFADQMKNPLVQLGASLFSEAMEEIVDELENEVNTLYTTTDMNYRQVLQQIADTQSSDYQKEAQEILKNYDRLNIALSGYKQTYSSLDYTTWTFKELHSGVEFIFEIHEPDEGQPTWECSAIQKSLEKYLEHLIL